MFWGTWDSNPGPNASRPTRLPPNQAAPIVNVMDKLYYIKKASNILENKKMREIDLNGPMKGRHIIVFFPKKTGYLPADFYPQEVS